jgi:hypothetical protein
MFLAIGVWLPDILLYSSRTLASSSDFSSRTPQEEWKRNANVYTYPIYVHIYTPKRRIREQEGLDERCRLACVHVVWT